MGSRTGWILVVACACCLIAVLVPPAFGGPMTTVLEIRGQYLMINPPEAINMPQSVFAFSQGSTTLPKLEGLDGLSMNDLVFELKSVVGPSMGAVRLTGVPAATLVVGALPTGIVSFNITGPGSLEYDDEIIVRVPLQSAVPGAMYTAGPITYDLSLFDRAELIYEILREPLISDMDFYEDGILVSGASPAGAAPFDCPGLCATWSGPLRARFTIVPVGVVPEPSAFVLALSAAPALAGLAWVRRRHGRVRY